MSTSCYSLNSLYIYINKYQEAPPPLCITAVIIWCDISKPRLDDIICLMILACVQQRGRCSNRADRRPSPSDGQADGQAGRVTGGQRDADGNRTKSERLSMCCFPRVHCSRKRAC